MPHIVKSTILDAPTGAVWNVLRDFNGHDRWHPAVATSTIERAQSSDRIGCVRRFKLKDGSELREQLLALSDLEQTFSYCLLDTPISMFNYVAHVRLLPVTDGDRTFWHWEFVSRRGRPTRPRSPKWWASRSIRPASRRSAGISREPHEHGDKIMPVTVKTFATSGDAAAALSSERDARYLGGGTLVMRALNEGDLSVSTVVRATDRALTQIEFASSRITIGAGVTFARVLAERELAFLHPVAASIGGPAVRNMGTVGGNLFAPTPSAISRVALLALDATVAVQGGYGARDVPIEEFLAGRDRQQGALVLSRLLPASSRRGVSLSQDLAHQAERRVAGDARSPRSDQRRPHRRRAHLIWCDGGDAGSRQGGRTRDRRPRARCGKYRRRGRRRDRRHFARQRFVRQRLVSARGYRRPSAPPAHRSRNKKAIRKAHGQDRPAISS